MNLKDTVEFVLSGFKALLHSDGKFDDATNIPIPFFDSITIINLCHLSIKTLEKQPTLLRIEPPVVVVGDLHGSFYDLLRIFSIFKQPPTTKYLFLGDYVDRGPFSLEVMIMLTSYQCAYPDHVFLVRGNHEIPRVNSNYGFKSNVIFAYGFDDIWHCFQKVFSWMPLAAIIGGEIFCVHGGISPLLQTVDQIENIKRPITSPTDDLINDLLWSDPSEKVKKFKPSERESGMAFGSKAIKQFFKSSGMKLIIRAHQFVEEGISIFEKAPLITVFSSSCYGKFTDSKSGVVVINEKNEYKTYSFPALKKLEREEALFFSLVKNSSNKVSKSVPRAIRSFFSYNQLLLKMSQNDLTLTELTDELPRQPRSRSSSPPAAPMFRLTSNPLQNNRDNNVNQNVPQSDNSQHSNLTALPILNPINNTTPQQTQQPILLKRPSNAFNSALIVFKNGKKNIDIQKSSSLPIRKDI